MPPSSYSPRRTHSRRAEDRARDAYDEFFRNAPDLLCVADLDAGLLLHVNPAFETAIGESAVELTGRPWIDLVHPDDRAETRRCIERLRGGERAVVFESRCRRIDHTYIALEWAATADLDTMRFHAVARDLGSRKEARAELEKTRSLLLAAIEQTPAGILIGDAPDVTIRMANTAALGIRGGPSSTLTDIPVERHPETWQTYHPDGTPFGADELPLSRAVLEGVTSKDVDIIIRNQDGEERWVSASAAPVRDSDGNIVAGVVVFPDVTDRMHREHALRLSEDRYRTLFEHAPEALVLLDADSGRFIDVNTGAERLFGLGRTTLLQHGPATLSPPSQPDGRPTEQAARDYIEQALSGGMPRFEWMHRNATGRDILCEIRLVQMPSESGRLVRGIITDITERRRMEEELAQSRKLEAIGRLAGGVAHDFNNLLTVINSCADLMLDEESRSAIAGYAEEILRAGERASALTAQLLAFGRKQVNRPSVVDLNVVIHDLMGMLRRVIGEDIVLRAHFDPGVRPVEIDPSQLEQVVLNLAVNARDAMAGGGELVIATRRAARGAGPAQGTYATAQTWSVLDITDSGPGIPDEIRDHIFEPFFTTKEGSGTGLGLATVYGIVRQNGGTVRLDTDRERGTRFEIWLPASSRDVEPGPSRHEEPHGIRGTERVLVVEDDPSVRDLMAASLRRYGYEIVQTSGAEEALDWLEDRSNRIDLLLTDLVMPGISGVELSRRAASLRPGLRVLLVSGYSDGLAPGAVGELGLSFLEKPFTPGVLAERVRDVLDGEP